MNKLLESPYTKIFIVTLVYFLMARLGLSLQFKETQVSPVWPPTGIALGFALLWGNVAYIGIFLGAFLANIVDFYLKAGAGAKFFSFIFEQGLGIWPFLMIAIGNTLESVGAIYLYKRLIAYKNGYFSDLAMIGKFCLILLLGCSISASIGSLSLWASGIIPGQILLTVFTTWLTGDFSGAIILFPFFIFTTKETFSNLKNDFIFLGGIFITCLTCSMTFLELGNFLFFKQVAYYLIPIIFSYCFLLNFSKSFFLVLITSSISIFGTLEGLGPFFRGDQNQSLILLQGFICVICLGILLIQYSILSQRHAELKLKELNKNLESKVQERTKELERSNLELIKSNRELDDFAYIASHDLKEPLRGIDNTITFMLEDNGKEFSEDAGGKFTKIRENIGRLNNLIDTLLYYSRLGRTESGFRETDLKYCIEEVEKSLQSIVERENVQIKVDSNLPKINCDSARISEVFRNLITNAIKYNDKKDKTIEIGFNQSDNGQNIYFVKDNGIGIKERHLDKVFKMFKRLHGRDKYGGGTGAGTTIVKKIIESHKGEIWIESEFGSGSTFFFTLSKGT